MTYHGLKLGGAVEGAPTDQSGGKSPEELAKEAAQFVVAEAEVLSHHVGETLLRLYLAHEYGDDSVPTLPMAGDQQTEVVLAGQGDRPRPFRARRQPGRPSQPAGSGPCLPAR